METYPPRCHGNRLFFRHVQCKLKKKSSTGFLPSPSFNYDILNVKPIYFIVELSKRDIRALPSTQVSFCGYFGTLTLQIFYNVVHLP